ncbi:MAG: hypothetical protein ACO1SV_02820 [Fimbriimonas sp.]
MLSLLKGPLALLCLLGCLAVASASPDVTSEGGTLIVNAVPVLKLRAGANGVDPTLRAQLVANAVGAANENDPVRVKKLDPDYQILVGDVPCLTVTRLDAKAYKTSPAALAKSWGQKLGHALALPPVKLSASTLQMPLGAVRKITFVGSRASVANVATNGDNVVAITRTKDGVQIKGIGVGSGSVVVEAGGYVEPINVSVKPYAAAFPQNVVAEVVGMPAAGKTVAGAIETALRTQLRGAPLVKMEYKLAPAKQLKTGAANTYVVRVKASAPDAYEATGKVNVVVRNIPVKRQPDAELWYSNNPEIVKRAQSLFSATLKNDIPARLLYHHVNEASHPLFLRVQAVNISDEPAKVLVMPGDSPPDRNPVLAGLLAADQYFRAWVAGSGEVVTIPPRSTLPISLRRLGPGETASGLCGLRLLSGPSTLLIRTDSWPPFQLDRRWAGAIASSTPWREVGCPPIGEFDAAPYTLSEHVYPNPQKQEQVRYEVGGRYGFVRIGQRAIARQDKNSRLDGNFGVIYNIKGSVENPTNLATDVEVVFEASAGYSGGLFVVDGNMVRTELLQPKAESQLLRFRIEPGASRSLNIWTIPLSGSSYPATITIRPLMNAGLSVARKLEK